MTGALQALLSAGGSQARVDVNDLVCFKTQKFGTATASYALANTGEVYKNGLATPPTWLKLGGAGDYDVRATQTGGDAISGTMAPTWQNLSSTVSWSITSTDGTLSGAMHVEIRDAISLAVLDAADITLTANISDPGGPGGP